MKKTLSEISNELNRQSGYSQLPPLIFITDQQAQKYPENIIDTLPMGSLVIFRDYHASNRGELGEALRYICAVRQIKFIVAGDLGLALALNADGIHLPEYMVDQTADIRADRPDYFITASAHSDEAVANAIRQGVDAILYGPVFPTSSHPETFDAPDSTVGPGELRRICQKYNFPIYALGGINPSTADEIRHSGVAGIAAIRGFV